MRPNCTDIQPAISLLVADELPPEDRPAVEAHLASCEACARLRQRFQRTNALLASAPVPSRDDLALMALRARAAGSASSATPANIRRHRLLAAAGLAAALLMPAATYFLFTPARASSSSFDPVASEFDMDF